MKDIILQQLLLNGHAFGLNEPNEMEYEAFITYMMNLKLVRINLNLFYM